MKRLDNVIAKNLEKIEKRLKALCGSEVEFSYILNIEPEDGERQLFCYGDEFVDSPESVYERLGIPFDITGHYHW